MKLKQTYEVWPVGRLQEHPKNPRRGDVEAIEESIDANGWYGACTVQKSTGHILAGNHRYKAAVARGAEEVPVIVVDVDDETATRILLADNKTADLGTYDEEVLQELLDGMQSLTGTGYAKQGVLGAMSALQEMEEQAEEESEAELAVPEDKYIPMFGVMIIVGSEEEQEDAYNLALELQGSGRIPEEAKVRLIAV